MELFLALLPIIVSLGLVLTTRKVGLSLVMGIMVGSIILYFTNDTISSPFTFIYDSVIGIITDFEWSMPILMFIVLVGVSTTLISHYGGTRRFAEVVSSKVTNKYAAQIIAAVLGLLIFVDDYLNSLVVGEVTKPITDRHNVSRAKLAYIVDTTSAPIVVLAIISTWGAYIIGLLGDYSFIDNTNLIFMEALKYQFYPIIAVVMMFLVIIFDINIGAMKRCEESATKGNDIASLDTAEETSEKNSSAWTLIIPLITLIVGIVVFWSMAAAKGGVDIQDTDITIPLAIAAFAMFVVTILVIKVDQKEINEKEMYTVIKKSSFELIKSVGFILICAWLLAAVMGELGTGEMISEIITDLGVDLAFLPLIVFVFSALIAFSTGTSWGTFVIMFALSLPLVGTDDSLLPIVIAAVLGGGVMGDHCSPISDTTVLSSTGTRCKLDIHFISQLPYAVIAGLITTFGYLALIITDNVVVTYVIIALLLALFVVVSKIKRT